MLKPRFIAVSLSVGLMAFSGLSNGQDFPNKPIRIVTSAVGGGNDFTARLIAQGLTDSLPHPVIVDNRNSVTAAEIGVTAPPDGYTLLVSGSTFWIRPLLQKTGYDPATDISPVTVVGMSPNVLVVHPSVAANSVKELIALAKAKPGMLNYSSGPPGTTQHLAAEIFKSMAGVNILHIAYKGAGPALIALTANEVQMMISTAASATPHIKSGRVRALAVTSAGPSALAPGLPTVAATVPGYEVVSVDAVFAPAKTPAVIINRLNQEIARVIKQPDIRERLLASGVEPVGGSPQQLAAQIKSETVILRKVIQEAGIRIE